MRLALFLLFVSFLAFSGHVRAEDIPSAKLIDRKINGTLLVDLLTKAQVPETAARRLLQFMDLNQGKVLRLKTEGNVVDVSIKNRETAVIIDFTLPSSERRFYYIHLSTGEVDKYFVAHGVNSGGNVASKFSNVPDSKQTSLGLYVTGPTYPSPKFGQALKMFGIERSNDRAYDRDIVFHGAPYVSMEFLEENGRMGRSFGCPAVSKAIYQKLVPEIANGTVIYHFHNDLIGQIQTSPLVQILEGPHDDVPPTREEETQN